MIGTPAIRASFRFIRFGLVVAAGWIGENLYLTSGRLSGTPIGGAVVDPWVGEKAFYNFATNACSREPCGHYTQVSAHSGD